MPTKSRFAPNDPLPQFLSDRVNEYALAVRVEDDEPRESILVLNAGILVMTTALISIAFTLSWGNPVKVFTEIKAAVIDNSPVRTDAVQATRSIRTTANVQALPPATPAREESSPAVDSAGQKAAGALLGQFQAWATTQDEPTQSGPAQDGPAQDRSAQDGSIYVAHAQPADDDRAQAQPVRPREVAPAQDAQDDEAPVRTVRRHRVIRPVQNARAEMRSARQALAHRLARARQDRIARAQVRPAQQQARAPEQPAQPVQPAQPPSLMQSFGWQQQ